MTGNENELELIKLSLSGDSDAYGCLVNSYSSRIFSIVYRMTNNYHEAEDITQETFVKAYDRLNNYKIRYKFFSWLCTIALNITRNRLRRKSILKFFSLDKRAVPGDEDSRPIELADGTLTPEEELLKKEKMGKINELVYSLPVRYREIFLMRNLEEMSYAEISRVTGLPMGTVENRLFRANKLISSKYREFFGEK